MGSIYFETPCTTRKRQSRHTTQKRCGEVPRVFLVQHENDSPANVLDTTRLKTTVTPHNTKTTVPPVFWYNMETTVLSVLVQHGNDSPECFWYNMETTVLRVLVQHGNDSPASVLVQHGNDSPASVLVQHGNDSPASEHQNDSPHHAASTE